MKKPLSVYVHIPFCIKKCSYCDFLSFSGMDSRFCAYTDALVREIESKKALGESHEVQTVFFGGGTPTVLPTDALKRIVSALRTHLPIAKNSEWSIEANPKTVTAQSLSALREMGFNRISFGVQSNHLRLLEQLGRIHDYSSFEQNFHEARRAGFENINLDLMFALPGQTLADWQGTLTGAVRLGPEHLSCYGLILEEGTKMYAEVHAGKLSLPGEDAYLEMFHYTRDYLSGTGYPPYEISNYAKPGYPCRHNIVYWRCDEYVGYGLGASSYLASNRFRNEDTLGKYVACGDFFPRFEQEQITGEDAVSEFMFMGLRMSAGVSLAAFERRFGRSMMHYYEKTMRDLLDKELIGQENGRIFLTPYGIDISNHVFAQFLL